MAKDLPAIPANSPLAALANQDSDLAAKKSLSFVQVFNEKSTKAAEIHAAIPGIKEGDVYAFDGLSYLTVDSVSLVGPTFRYWAKKNRIDYKIEEATLTAPERGSDLKEEIACLMLAYCGDRLIPTLTTFRSAKCPAIQDLVNGQTRAGDDEFVKASGPVGKVLASLPVALRVAGTIDAMLVKSSYWKAKARTRLLNDKETQLLLDALNDPEFNEWIAGLTEAYEYRKNLVTKIANGETE